jgi:hypothetical protein
MSGSLTPGQKAAFTRRRRAAAAKALTTKKRMTAWEKAHAAEAASKDALKMYCKRNGWKVAFFEGKTGAPRTGIIDAIAFRLDRKNADALDIRLIQLKGGKAGISGPEIARLKMAVKVCTVEIWIAAFDGQALQLLLPEDPKEPVRKSKADPSRRAAAKRAWDTIRRKKIDAAEAALMQPVVKAEPL